MLLIPTECTGVVMIFLTFFSHFATVFKQYLLLNEAKGGGIYFCAVRIPCNKCSITPFTSPFTVTDHIFLNLNKCPFKIWNGRYFTPVMFTVQTPAQHFCYSQGIYISIVPRIRFPLWRQSYGYYPSYAQFPHHYTLYNTFLGVIWGLKSLLSDILKKSC